MEMYSILVNTQEPSTIFLNKNLLNRLELDEIKKVNLKHGLNTRLVSISVSDHLQETEISISNNLIDELCIQTSARYELLLNGDELLIGPFIGIVYAGKEGSKMKIRGLSRYTKYYNKIGGTIVAFTLTGINQNTNMIKGFIYNPKTGSWGRGIFPLPSAVFNRIILKKRWRAYFKSIIGNKFFNSYWFNKWSMHKWLSPYKMINKHLPDTILYTKPTDIVKHLERHQKIYIKPSGGSSGKGIYELSKTKSGYILKNRFKRKNYEKTYQSIAEVVGILKNKLRKNRYVIQQSIDLTFNGMSIYDFRLVLVKDQSGNWKDKGLLGRKGPENSVVSNRSNGGRLELGETILQQVFNMDVEEAKAFRKEMANIGIAAAEKLDLHHHYGNFGVDFGIDKNKHIWVLEINNRDPAHYNASRINRRDLVYDASLANMLYLKKIAGFPKRLP